MANSAALNMKEWRNLIGALAAKSI